MSLQIPITDKDILIKLIPQKDPFVMVDKLIYSDSIKTVSGLKISSSNIFTHNNIFTEPGMIENIAQTAALRIGYVIQEMVEKDSGAQAPIGYIGAIKDLKIHALPYLDEEIRTEIVFEKEVLDVSLITGRVYCGEDLLAECEMKIFVKKD